MTPAGGRLVRAMSDRSGATFVGLALLFHLDKLLLGPWGVVRFHDTFDSEFPRYASEGALLLAHGPFGWYPHLAGGMPAHAIHYTPLYPLCWLTALVGPWLVYALATILLMAGAGYGMARYLRGFLGVDPGLALFGGVLFALTSQVQANAIPHTALNSLLPLLLVWLHRPGREGEGLAWGPTAGVLALMVYAYPVLTLPMFPLAHGALLAWGERPAGRSDWLRAGALWGGFVLLAAPVLWALLEYVPLAQRGYPTAPGSLGAAAWAWLGEGQAVALDTGWRAAVLPLLAAGLPLALGSRRVRGASLLVGLALGVGSLFRSPLAGTPALAVLRRLDLGHFTWLLPFGLTLLAVLVLEALAGADRRRRLLAAGLGAVALGALAGSAARSWMLLAAAGALVAGLACAEGTAAASAAPRPSRLVPAALLGGLVLLALGARSGRRVLESWPYRRDLVAPGRVLEALPESFERPVRVGCLGVHPAVAQLRGRETVGGRSPLFNGRYKQLLEVVLGDRLEAPGARQRFRSYWYDLLLGDADLEGLRLDLLRLLNVRYLLAARELAATPGVSLVQAAPAQVEAGPPWVPGALRAAAPVFLYRLEGAFERAFLATRVRLVADHPAALAALGAAPLGELGATALVVEGEAPGEEAWLRSLASAGAAGDPAVVRVRRQGPDRIRVRGHAPGPGVLVVSENFDPHLYAEVDGSPAPVLRVDHALAGVPIRAAGDFEVVLEYRDPAQPGLWLVASLGLALMGVGVAAGRGGGD